MAFEQRDNSGALFKNDKGDNPARPDYRGDAMIDGTTYEMSAWIKEGKKGKFMSVSFKTKGDDKPRDKLKEPPPAGQYDDEGPPF